VTPDAFSGGGSKNAGLPHLTSTRHIAGSALVGSRHPPCHNDIGKTVSATRGTGDLRLTIVIGPRARFGLLGESGHRTMSQNPTGSARSLHG
jgi:hypothetical protein